jgi:hypothetical protein
MHRESSRSADLRHSDGTMPGESGMGAEQEDDFRADIACVTCGAIAHGLREDSGGKS